MDKAWMPTCHFQLEDGGGHTKEKEWSLGTDSDPQPTARRQDLSPATIQNEFCQLPE